MGNFFHILTETDLEAFIGQLRELFADRGRLEMSVNALDGQCWAPSKKRNLYRVSIAFNADQFATLNEIMEGAVIGIVFPKKKE